MIATRYIIPFALLGLSGSMASAENESKVLYKEVVAPVLEAKCASCHGEEKQKGDLRVDTLAAMMEGGSEGASVVPGDPDGSPLLERVYLPLDDDEHMPPEGKEQLTDDEIKLLEYWVKSGARGDATLASLKAPEDVTKLITSVLAALPEKKDVKPADAPKAISEADKKLIAETIGQIKEAGGGNLMAIAQDTPQLRFSALNVAKEFGDQHMKPLEKVGEHILWLDLARTQVSDKGLQSLQSMQNLTRLHLENTKVTDAGLDHIKGLSNLEYLNLYGTGITDAGVAKLASNKNLKKLFLWQTKATDKAVDALAKAVPGIDINTGWKEPVKVAAVTPAKPAAAAPTNPPAKPKPATPAKPAPKKAEPNSAPAKTTPKAKPAPAPAKPATAAKGNLEDALAELTAAAEEAKKKSVQASKVYKDALKRAEDATKEADRLKAAAEKASSIENQTVKALQELIKAVEASRTK